MADATGSGALDAGSLIGQTLAGRYVIESQLGKGGMAVVYKAKDKSFGRGVAIKVLRTDVAKDPVAAKRLVREARAAGQLHHPNIITMHDVGESNGLVYIVMEILRGSELSDVMEEEGAIDVARSLDIGRQVASALVVAHRNGIIHRDIKPENLFLVDGGGGREIVKMLDFSIAKLPTNMVTAALTRAGSVFGTPHYMAPEQVEGRQVCSQTDLYALGAVLYELIAGEPPFDGNSVIDILLQHAKAPPPKLADTGIAIPAGLSELVDSLLAKSESDRPASASEVEQRLTRLIEDLNNRPAAAPAQVDDEEEPAPTVAMAAVSNEQIAAELARKASRVPRATHPPPDFGPPPGEAPDGELSAADRERIRRAEEAKAKAKAAGAPANMHGAGVAATAREKPAPSLDLPDGLDLPDAAPTRNRPPFGGASTGDEATLIGAGMAAKVREEAARIERERAEKAAEQRNAKKGGSSAKKPRKLGQKGGSGPSRKVKVNVPPPPGARADLPSVSAPSAVRSSGKLRRAPRSPAEVRRDSNGTADDSVQTVDMADVSLPPAPDPQTRARAAQETLAVSGEQLEDLKRQQNAQTQANPTTSSDGGDKKILFAAVAIAAIGLLALAGAAFLILGR